MSTHPITHANLLGLRFPQKLWLLANRSLTSNAPKKTKHDCTGGTDLTPSLVQTPTTLAEASEIWDSNNEEIQQPPDDICEWSRNGTAIRIRLDRLDSYLDGGRRSIFRTRLPCLWLRQLCAYGFQRIGADNRQPLQSVRSSLLQLLHAPDPSSLAVCERPPLDVDVHEYRHEAFRRDRPHLIDSIRLRHHMATGEDTTKLPVAAEVANIETHQRQLRTLLRQQRRQHRNVADPCKRLVRRNAHYPMSASTFLCSARLRLRTVLRERSVRSMLTEKLERYAHTGAESIELPCPWFIEFASPADAVSGFEKREVAGFYGDGVNVAAVKRFFGEYLPTHPNDEIGTSLVVDAAASNAKAQMQPAVSSDVTMSGPIAQAASDDLQQFMQMPHFQIMHNTDAADPNDVYSLQMIGGSLTTAANASPTTFPTTSTTIKATMPMPIPTTLAISSDYGAQALANINQFTPIQYDTSFLDEFYDISRNNEQGDSKNDQGTDIVGTRIDTDETRKCVVEPPINDDDDDNFDIDQFFRMKPRVNVNTAIVPAEKNPIGVAFANVFDPLDAELQTMQQDDVLAKVEMNIIAEHQLNESTAAESEEQSAANADDIIQQAAYIDDDFFSQIRESMDVLYENLC